MSALARFQQYAEAFEEVFESDDWSHLEPYFTEDAVYEIHAAPPRRPYSGHFCSATEPG